MDKNWLRLKLPALSSQNNNKITTKKVLPNPDDRGYPAQSEAPAGLDGSVSPSSIQDNVHSSLHVLLC